MVDSPASKWKRIVRFVEIPKMFALLGSLVVVAPSSLDATSPALEEGPTYIGMCDASAAVAVDGNRFLIANDEDNVVRLYEHGQGGKAVRSFDFTAFLHPDPEHPETDIEGTTWLGHRIFWITSHGRNKNGNVRSSRHRLFASRFESCQGVDSLVGAGVPYTQLVEDLIRDPRFQRYNLEKASRKAPKSRGALNIEGLTSTPDGRLLIGFRNPIPDDKALIAAVENPDEIVTGQRAQLGDPIQIDLDGLGVRSIEFDRDSNQYLILAGKFSASHCRLYAWSGRPETPPQVIPGVEFGDLTPESFTLYDVDERRTLHVFSDDGTRRIGLADCKRIEPSRQHFRSAFVRWREPTGPSP